MEENIIRTTNADNNFDLVHEARMNLLSARYRIRTHRK
jgi:hypothetical protein